MVSALGAAGLLLAGCGLGYGGDEPSGTQIPLEEGSTVTVLEVEVPDMQSFVLRGTFPVPPGVFPASGGEQPFGVVDVDGETYGAQAEVTSWYPNDAADGADVVEVIARVNRGDQEPGSRAQYRVVLASHPAQPDPGTPGIEDLKNGPLAVPDAVKNLLGSSSNIEVRSRDCFDNLYVARPLEAGSGSLLRFGEHVAELRVYQHLVPNPPVSGPAGTLPHWLGVHTYLSTWNGEEILGFDLRVNNADSGNDTVSPLDDPLGTVYFKDLEIAVPNGWVVVQDFDDPFLGNPFGAGGKSVFPIVKPIGGTKMHVIPWSGQFHRRLAICRIENAARARALLRGAGLGFARRGTDPFEGHKYWSWWNTSTARYFPQSQLLPSLDHVGLSTVVNKIKSERNQVQGYLENGTSAGGYPVSTGVMGWAHPYGVAYGGMSGGSEINLFDGVSTAWSAEVAGYQKFRIIHRMQSDRMPNALYNVDGKPSSVEDWLLTSGAGKYVPFDHFNTPSLTSQDVFGVWKAPSFQVDHVTAAGMKPDYESTLLGYEPYDYQHFIRYTRSAKVLAWLANDSLAKDDLRMQAENFRLSYHPYNNNIGGGFQSTGMKWDIDYVEKHFASGFRIGRGEGWGLDCSLAAYATADPGWRAARREWFDVFAQLVGDGQAACSGFLQANISAKSLDGKYRTRQAIEHSILDNALVGLLETVYRGKDVAYTAILKDVIEDSLYGLISDMSWGAGKSAPWQYSAVGPLNEDLPVWCSFAQMPADGYTADATDAFQDWSEFAYGHALTGNQKFLNHASLQLGGTSDVLGALESGGLNNLENRAGLLAYLQYLNGDL